MRQKLSGLMIVFALVLCLLPFSNQPVVSAQEYPTTISITESTSATGYNNTRKIVRLSDGTLYCVYNKRLAEKHQIYIAKSTDNVGTWTNETRLSTYEGMDGQNQYTPAIAVDSFDYLHVIWEGTAAGYTTHNQVWYAKYTTSWGTPVRVSTHEGMDVQHQSYSSFAVDSSGHPHVVWQGVATGYTYRQIWYAEYTDSWVDPVRVSTHDGMDGQDQSVPSITVDSSDYIHVAWNGMATGYTTNTQIWYAKYTDSWADPVRVSTYDGMGTYGQAYSSIAVDSNDYPHVVWHGMATGYDTHNQIWHAKCTPSWTTPVRVSTHDGMGVQAQGYPSIAVDSSDHLHVLWQGKATGYTDYDKVWYANYEVGWAAPECLQATGQNALPNIRWSRWPVSNIPTNRLDYVFTEGTASPYNIKFDVIYIEQQVNTVGGSATVTNVYPSVTSVQITDIGDTPVSALDPWAYCKVKVTVSDANSLEDISGIEVKMFPTSVGVDAADAARNHYTFKYDATTTTWSEIGPDSFSPYDHIDVGTCESPSLLTLTSGTYIFKVRLAKVAEPSTGSGWTAEAIATDSDEASGDNTTTFDVTDYIELAVDGTTLTFSGAPGDTDVDASENPSVATVTSNNNFDIKISLSGNWTGGIYSGSIPAGNTKAAQNVTPPGEITLSTSSQALWTDVGFGEGVTNEIYWFLDMPSPCRDDTYTVIATIEAVKHTV